MKKRYRFEFSSVRFVFVILSFTVIGVLIFTMGFMAGYHTAGSSYEEIIVQAASEGQERIKGGVALFKIADGEKNNNSPAKPASSFRRDKSSAIGLYSVQVASFKRKANAENLKSRLRKKAYDAFVQLASLGKKGTWYRVFVGRFHGKKEAGELARDLMKKEKLKGLIHKQ